MHSRCKKLKIIIQRKHDKQIPQENSILPPVEVILKYLTV